LCPVTVIARRSTTPALTMFRTAVRRKSCRSIPGAPDHAVELAFERLHAAHLRGEQRWRRLSVSTSL
jgi:hypothetical protein